MATSACPVLARLRPMAQQHLPFASNREFILRAVALYLARQYFNSREGRRPDWELRGLVKAFQQLQLVNQPSGNGFTPLVRATPTSRHS